MVMRCSLGFRYGRHHYAVMMVRLGNGCSREKLEKISLLAKGQERGSKVSVISSQGGTCEEQGLNVAITDYSVEEKQIDG